MKLALLLLLTMLTGCVAVPYYVVDTYEGPVAYPATGEYRVVETFKGPIVYPEPPQRRYYNHSRTRYYSPGYPPPPVFCRRYWDGYRWVKQYCD